MERSLENWWATRPQGSIKFIFREFMAFLKQRKSRHYLVLERGIEYTPIDYSRILAFQAHGAYTKVFCLDEAGQLKVYTEPGTLKQIEAFLDSDLFIRTHRSYIVNIKHVKKCIKKGRAGVIYFTLESAPKAYFSTRFRAALIERQLIR